MSPNRTIKAARKVCKTRRGQSIDTIKGNLAMSVITVFEEYVNCLRYLVFIDAINQSYSQKLADVFIRKLLTETNRDGRGVNFFR